MSAHRRGTFDVAAFYTDLDTRRNELGISWRELLRQAGFGNVASISTRLQQGQSLSSDSLARLILWLGKTDIGPYLRRTEDAPQLYLVWSNWHRAWWGPKRSGYYTDARAAGRYLLADAEDICRSRTWEIGEYAPEVAVACPTAVRMADPGIERELRDLALAVTEKVGRREASGKDGGR